MRSGFFMDGAGRRLRTSTAYKKRQRRAMRKQAALIAYLPYKAARLMRQARNG